MSPQLRKPEKGQPQITEGRPTVSLKDPDFLPSALPPSKTKTSKNSKFYAGQVCTKVHVWETLGAPMNVLSIIKGYRIPFIARPPLYRFDKSNHLRYQTETSDEMSKEIRNLLESGAARKSRNKSGFLSPLFLRKKSDGSYRPIFDLRNLNFFLRPPKFRLLNHLKIPFCLNKTDFMTKLDLSQAYFHIPITKAHHRFLAFAYKSAIYEMTCLPFGLATAPYAFASVSNWLANHFRKEGIR